ncbi:MAG: YbaB/EbfC family nucleoid-associated protein [Lachnospiraceae bacterium]|nr:YbaB/EbfC family nucleoid-associated protein [Lachnospiraceae bacterium]
MAKRGGFPGGMPGSQANMMKQIQRMQRQFQEKQEELAQKVFTATAGGGAVTAEVSGEGKLLAVKLQEEVVDPEDIEMLEDLIVAAVNEAMRAQEEEYQKVMGANLGGNLGGLGGLGF